MDEFIGKHVIFQDRNTDKRNIRYLKRSTLNEFLRNGRFDTKFNLRRVASALDRKSIFSVPYSRKHWVPQENPFHKKVKTLTGWKGVYLRNVEEDDANGKDMEE